jgi:hypothetical protein
MRMNRSLLKSRLLFAVLAISSSCFWSAVGRAQMQTKDITCNNGSGEYTTQFSSGITVEVGPVRKGEFADRACAARLVAKGEEVSVVDDAGQVGIDVLGADLGLGRPVVAFQIDRTGSGTNVVYQIYSLKKPAQMIYKLSGGDYYSAADTDMDGSVEIWTDDASVMDGFEGVPGVDFDVAPTIVLRFENGNPVDVGSEIHDTIRRHNLEAALSTQQRRPRGIQAQRWQTISQNPAVR